MEVWAKLVAADAASRKRMATPPIPWLWRRRGIPSKPRRSSLPLPAPSPLPARLPAIPGYVYLILLLLVCAVLAGLCYQRGIFPFRRAAAQPPASPAGPADPPLRPRCGRWPRDHPGGVTHPPGRRTSRLFGVGGCPRGAGGGGGWALRALKSAGPGAKGPGARAFCLAGPGALGAPGPPNAAAPPGAPAGLLPKGMLSPENAHSFLLSPAPSACRSQNAPSIPCKGGDPMPLRLLPLLLALLALWGCAPQSMPAPSAVPTPTAAQALSSPSPSLAGVPHAHAGPHKRAAPGTPFPLGRSL